MKEKFKTTLIQIFGTKIGWAAISMVLVIIFGIFSTHSTIIDNGYVWCDFAMMVPLGYLIILSITMIVYGLFINPLKKFMKK